MLAEKNQNKHSMLNSSFDALAKWHEPHINYLIHYDINFRRYAGIPDFLTADDMEGMVRDNRLDPKMIFSYVQEVYRMCNEM